MVVLFTVATFVELGPVLLMVTVLDAELPPVVAVAELLLIVTAVEVELLLLALPVVALPPLVLPDTLALPLVAV